MNLGDIGLSTFLQHTINGIALGSLYALISIGYTMVYGILRMINFAHGDIFMMACYFGFFSMVSFGMPWYIAIILVIICTIFLGVGIEKTAYKPLRDADKNSILISAIGVSFLLQNLATYLFSGKPKSFPEIPMFSRMLTIGGLNIQAISIYIPIVTVIALFILLFIVNKTKVGIAMRAVSRDYETASIMGVNIDRIISLTFVIGSTLASFGAMMWSVRYPGILPIMGVVPGLKCFIAAVIGGIGNIKGAVLGGFILGIGEIYFVAFLPELSGYRDAFAFIMLIVILLCKPTGLLGEKIAEKV